MDTEPTPDERRPVGHDEDTRANCVDQSSVSRREARWAPSPDKEDHRADQGGEPVQLQPEQRDRLQRRGIARRASHQLPIGVLWGPGSSLEQRQEVLAVAAELGACRVVVPAKVPAAITQLSSDEADRHAGRKRDAHENDLVH